MTVPKPYIGQKRLGIFCLTENFNTLVPDNII